jgi:hypothetical protein
MQAALATATGTATVQGWGDEGDRGLGAAVLVAPLGQSVDWTFVVALLSDLWAAGVRALVRAGPLSPLATRGCEGTHADVDMHTSVGGTAGAPGAARGRVHAEAGGEGGTRGVGGVAGARG